MQETKITMKDFDLGSTLGQIRNKEDRRVWIEKANAKAALTIVASKKARNQSTVNREVEDYVSKVRDAIREDNIPIEVTTKMFNDRIKAITERKEKILRLKDKQRGFLAKSQIKALDNWERAIKDLETERDSLVEHMKQTKQPTKGSPQKIEETFDVTTPAENPEDDSLS